MTNSLRIQEICKQVSFDVIAEIGCDHAYITKTLLDSKKIKFAYLTDISEKCLQKAVENLKAYKKNTYFSVGNGLKALAHINFIKKQQVNTCLSCDSKSAKGAQELDNISLVQFSKQERECEYPLIQQVIIAGMGGYEIIKILEQNKNNEFTNFILQPQKNVVELRTFLQQNNYEIINDELVQEGKMFYFVLTAIEINKKPKPLSTFELYFGNATNKHILKNYLSFELEKRKIISKQKKIIENETLIRLIHEYLLNL